MRWGPLTQTTCDLYACKAISYFAAAWLNFLEQSLVSMLYLSCFCSQVRKSTPSTDRIRFAVLTASRSFDQMITCLANAANLVIHFQIGCPLANRSHTPNREPKVNAFFGFCQRKKCAIMNPLKPLADISFTVNLMSGSLERQSAFHCSVSTFEGEP